MAGLPTRGSPYFKYDPRLENRGRRNPIFPKMMTKAIRFTTVRLIIQAIIAPSNFLPRNINKNIKPVRIILYNVVNIE